MPKNAKSKRRTMTPALTVRDAAKSIEFYKKAFGAEEHFRMPGPDGKIMHAELQIGDSIFMLGPECGPEGLAKAPATLKATTFSSYLDVADVDAAFAKAVKAGAKSVMPVADMFWGDRCGQVQDPDGHLWFLATRKEDLSLDEIAKRRDEFFAARK